MTGLASQAALLVAVAWISGAAGLGLGIYAGYCVAIREAKRLLEQERAARRVVEQATAHLADPVLFARAWRNAQKETTH